MEYTHFLVEKKKNEHVNELLFLVISLNDIDICKKNEIA